MWTLEEIQLKFRLMVKPGEYGHGAWRHLEPSKDAAWVADDLQNLEICLLKVARRAIYIINGHLETFRKRIRVKRMSAGTGALLAS